MQGMNSSLLNLLAGAQGGQGNASLQGLMGGKKSSGDMAKLLQGGEGGSPGEFSQLFADIQSKLQSQLREASGDLKGNLAQELQTFLKSNPSAEKVVDQLLQSMGQAGQKKGDTLSQNQAIKDLLAKMQQGSQSSLIEKNSSLKELLKGTLESKNMSKQDILSLAQKEQMSPEKLLEKLSQKLQKEQAGKAALTKEAAAGMKGKKIQGKGSDDFLQNIAVLNKNTVASLKKGKDGENQIQTTKTSNNIKGYGKTQQGAQNSLFNLNANMFNEKGKAEAGPLEGMAMGEKNQDAQMKISPKQGMEGFQLDAQLSREMAPKTTMKASENTKVIDMRGMDTSNKMEVINRIQKNIEQANFQRKGQLDLLIKHDDLGNFRVQVNKTGAGRQVDMQIQTGTRQAHDFFARHEAELMKTLDRSGVKLADFRLMSGSSKEFSQVILNAKNSGQLTQSDSQSSGNKEGQFSQNSNGQHSSQGEGRGQQQSQKDSERRRQMWEEYRERMAA